MSFGLSLYNSDGGLGFSTESIGANYLGSFTASANSTVSYTIPHYSLMNTIYTQHFMINDLPTDQEAHSHTISISAGVVTATKASSGGQTTHIIVLGK